MKSADSILEERKSEPQTSAQHRVLSPIADDVGVAPSRRSDGVPLVLSGTRTTGTLGNS